jgi:hypothetical protein
VPLVASRACPSQTERTWRRKSRQALGGRGRQAQQR